MKIHILTAAALTLLAASVPTDAQNVGFGTLSNLATPRGGKTAHFSSTDLKGGNGDARPVAPGETLTLVDAKGAGIVRRWWVTIAPRNNRQLQRQLIVRCYWDGEQTPSVEVPISDFFGLGFGEWKDFQSLPLNMTSGGYNCYWAMPFHKSARITVENKSKVRVDAFYYNIDVEMHPKIPANLLYFHAQFRRTRPTQPGQPVTILEATGKGQYVGTVLSMQMVRGRSIGFLEGDERVTVDGEASPSIVGTGTEDYFSSGWYFDTGPYSALYHGCPIKDTEHGRISAYRWHIEDAIPFDKSMRFTIEHGGGNDVRADYCSVAFWYQTHPRAPFPLLPADLMPAESEPVPHQAGMVEGESLLASAKATEGPLETQDMESFSGEWSGLSQLWWRPTQVGAKLAFTLNAPEAKTYELVGYFTGASDYGNLRFSVNGQAAGEFAGFAPVVSRIGPVSLGRVPLKAGANSVTVEVTGKDARSSGYLAGIDGFLLKP